MATKNVVSINSDDISGVKLTKNRNRLINIKMATNNAVRNITPDFFTSEVEILLTANNISPTLGGYLYRCLEMVLMELLRLE
jgi:hypothetical protein